MNTNASCYGEMFGHNFEYTGADCLQCGVNQNDLGGKRFKPVIETIKKTVLNAGMPDVPVKGIHSQLHWLVAELRKDFGETAKAGPGSFGYYLGLLKRIGFPTAFRLWTEVRQDAGPGSGRLFWWKYKELLKKPVDNQPLTNHPQ